MLVIAGIAQLAVVILNRGGLGLLAGQVILSAWVLVPFAGLYLLAARNSSVTAVAIAAALLLAEHGFFLFTYLTSSSSTSALIFLVTPIYELVPLGLLLSPEGIRTQIAVVAVIAIAGSAALAVRSLGRAAADPSASAERLRALADGRFGSLRTVKLSLAGNATTPADVLDRLAREADTIVIQRVGFNPSTPPDVLDRIAASRGDYVALAGVASNPHTPVAALRRIVSPSSKPQGGPERKLYETYVVAAVAGNAASPADLLADLGPITEYFTVTALANNPKTPCSTLDTLGTNGEGRSRDVARRMFQQRCAAK